MVNFSVIDGHPGQVKLCLPLCPSVAANQLESPRSACAVPGRIYAARWSPPPAGGEPVKLSILLPTHRHSLQACSKIAQACSLAGPDIEVIVRDNSGNTRKRKLLANFQRDNCRLITVEPCGPRENYSETLRQATGDFVFSVGDDDTFFDHAVSDLPSVIAQIGADRSFIGITGSYAIETSKGTSLVTYQNIDSDDPGARAVGFLNYPGPNVLFYSVLRRELVNRVSAFMDVMPFFLSFHDQILSMLYLLSGKFLCLPRLMYLYDLGIWETTETAQQCDLDFYRTAGLDPAINKLHWFLCGFEGAVLALNSPMFSDIPRPQRQQVADRWFSQMFARFAGQPRQAFGSALAGEAEALHAKLLASTGQLSFDGMLAQISGFMALCSEERGERYFAFWNNVLKQTKPAAMQKASA